MKSNISCPKCQSRNVDAIRRDTLVGFFLRLLHLRIYNCRACHNRFPRRARK